MGNSRTRQRLTDRMSVALPVVPGVIVTCLASAAPSSNSRVQTRHTYICFIAAYLFAQRSYGLIYASKKTDKRTVREISGSPKIIIDRFGDGKSEEKSSIYIIHFIITVDLRLENERTSCIPTN